MNPSKLFILRPVATSLLMIAFVLVGLVAFRYLPVSALPDVTYPTIQVQTFYPGASPEVMTSAVTAPLERQLGEMTGLNQMASSSSAGASVITLQFDLSLSLDVAEQEVQAAINAAGNLLPSDLPAPPVYAKVNPADAPVMTLAITSKTMNLTDVENIANARLASKLSEIPGVGLVTVSGGNVPSIRVEVNPQALASYGLSIDNIRTDIGNLNVNSPKGSFSGLKQSFTINANDQITDASEYAKLVIAYKNGNPVYLGDVAKIMSAPQDTELGAWANRTPAIVLNIQRQPNANAIAHHGDLHGSRQPGGEHRQRALDRIHGGDDIGIRLALDVEHGASASGTINRNCTPVAEIGGVFVEFSRTAAGFNRPACRIFDHHQFVERPAHENGDVAAGRFVAFRNAGACGSTGISRHDRPRVSELRL